MSADLLRKAADRLDSYAAPLVDERWDYDKFSDDEPWVVLLDQDFDGDDIPTVATLGRECIDRDRGGWIAKMGPQVAGPLSQWLRTAADAVDRYPGMADGPDSAFVRLMLDSAQPPAYRYTTEFVQAALTFAGTVLSEPDATPSDSPHPPAPPSISP